MSERENSPSSPESFPGIPGNFQSHDSNSTAATQWTNQFQARMQVHGWSGHVRYVINKIDSQSIGIDTKLS